MHPKQVRLFWWGYMSNGNKSEAENENRSHRYGINRPRPGYWYKYTKYKMLSQYNDGYMY